MKAGSILTKPTTAALIFENFVMGVLFMHLLVLYRRLLIPPAWQILGFFAAALAPLLVFSTTRIYQDALTGIFIACAIIAFIEALEKRSTIWSVWSGFLFAAALNLRYTAIVSLPLIVFCQMIYLYSSTLRQSESIPKKDSLRAMLKFRHWRVFTIAFLIIATLGLEHFYRLFATYGSIFPWDFMHRDPAYSWNQFIQTRSRVKNFTNLTLLIPLLMVFFLPQTWRTIKIGLACRNWGAIYAVFFLYLLAVLFIFSYEEMRFFAVAMPMFYCCVPWIMAQTEAKFLPLKLCLIAISLCMMIAADYREVVVRPNEVFRIVPALYDFVPPLRQYW